jgi:hypothetical protein
MMSGKRQLRRSRIDVNEVVRAALDRRQTSGRQLWAGRVRGAFSKQKQRRGNSAEGIAQFVAEHREELDVRTRRTRCKLRYTDVPRRPAAAP